MNSLKMPKVDSLILSKKERILSDVEKIVNPKNVLSHTGATTTTTTTANQSCLSRVRTADVLSLHEASARANGDYR